jgi:hypothetical protein
MKVRLAPAIFQVEQEGDLMDAADVPRPAIVSTAVADDAGAAPPPGPDQPAPAPAEPPLAPLPPPAPPAGASTPAPPAPPASAAPSSPEAAPAPSPAPAAPPPAAPAGQTTPSPSTEPLRRGSQLDFKREWERTQIVPREAEKAPLELGVGAFFWVGGAAGSYLGVSPFLYADVGQAVFLRPSVAVATSTATNISSTLAAARLDTCFRFPGRYAVQGGMQIDLCGGVDAGFSYVSSGTTMAGPGSGQTVPLVDIGPSVDLRAEAGDVGITLRVQGGLNVAQQGFDDSTGAHVDLPLVTYRLEMGISWVMRGPVPEIPQESGSR